MECPLLVGKKSLSQVGEFKYQDLVRERAESESMFSPSSTAWSQGIMHTADMRFLQRVSGILLYLEIRRETLQKDFKLWENPNLGMHQKSDGWIV